MKSAAACTAGFVFVALSCLPASNALAESTTSEHFPEQLASGEPGEVQQQCDLYQIDAKKVADKYSGGSIFSGVGSDLSCLRQIVDKALEPSFKELKEDLGSDAPQTVDDIRSFLKIWEESRLEDQYPTMSEEMQEFITEADEEITDYCDELFDDGDAYMDNECKVIDSKKGKTICGTLQVRYANSPISLLWTDKAAIDELTFVQFPINPTVRNAFYSWRASADTPLLVYDPEHAGRISDGAQLFGNFTFYGQRTAALNGGRVGGPWKNGYEALGSLDRNNDGKVSGGELEPLALWFDRNRDAASQEGEVIPLSEVQVTALFYAPDRRDERTGDLYASVGFEREVDGKKLIGASVDWFSDHAISQFELMQSHIISQPPRQLAAPQIASHEDQVAAAGKPAAPSFDGVWNWSIDGDVHYGAFAPRGIMVISEGSDGRVTGRSLVEMPLRPNSHGIKSYIRSDVIAGRIVTGADGGKKLSFEVQGASGAKTSSEAVLAADGGEIQGRSETQWSAANGGTGDKYGYKWTASRYLPQK